MIEIEYVRDAETPEEQQEERPEWQERMLAVFLANH